MAGLVQLDNNGNLIELGTPIDVSNVTDVPIKALTTWTSRTLSVTATAVEVTGSSPLAARKTITLKADGNNAAPVYVGPTNAVGAAAASLGAGEALTLELDDSASVWAVVNNGSEQLDVVEVA